MGRYTHHEQTQGLLAFIRNLCRANLYSKNLASHGGAFALSRKTKVGKALALNFSEGKSGGD